MNSEPFIPVFFKGDKSAVWETDSPWKIRVSSHFCLDLFYIITQHKTVLTKKISQIFVQYRLGLCVLGMEEGVGREQMCFGILITMMWDNQAANYMHISLNYESLSKTYFSSLCSYHITGEQWKEAYVYVKRRHLYSNQWIVDLIVLFFPNKSHVSWFYEQPGFLIMLISHIVWQNPVKIIH